MAMINIKNKLIIISLIIVIVLTVFLVFFLGFKVGKIGGYGYMQPVFNEEGLNIIRVTDEDMEEISSTDLNIFENKKFNNQDIIAPRSNGSYRFYVENLTNKKVLYDIVFLDEMSNKVNMKYKLKIDNVYVKGNDDTYIDINDLSINDVVILENSVNMLMLEWYWEDDDINDTYVGSLKSEQYYTLKLEVDARLMD